MIYCNLLTERDELKQKTVNLTYFLNERSEEAGEHLPLMKAQLPIMLAYLSVLEQRIVQWNT